MNEYQTRSECGWLRHMALCMLTQIFINKSRQKSKHQLRLTTADILKCIQLKAIYLKRTMEDLFAIILRKQPYQKKSLEKLLQLRM